MSRRAELANWVSGVEFPVSGFTGDWREVSGVVTKVGVPRAISRNGPPPLITFSGGTQQGN